MVSDDARPAPAPTSGHRRACSSRRIAESTNRRIVVASLLVSFHNQQFRWLYFSNIAFFFAMNGQFVVRSYLAYDITVPERWNSIGGKETVTTNGVRRTLPAGRPWRDGMPMLPSERLKLLREHHIDGTTPLQDHCLAALVLGYTNDEAGAMLDMSPHTYRRHISDLANHVLVPTGFRPGRDLLVTWFWLHTEDCSALAMLLIRRDMVARRRR